jgi:hypothetical protein
LNVQHARKLLVCCSVLQSADCGPLMEKANAFGLEGRRPQHPWLTCGKDRYREEPDMAIKSLRRVRERGTAARRGHGRLREGTSTDDVTCHRPWPPRGTRIRTPHPGPRDSTYRHVAEFRNVQDELLALRAACEVLGGVVDGVSGAQ